MYFLSFLKICMPIHEICQHAIAIEIEENLQPSKNLNRTARKTFELHLIIFPSFVSEKYNAIKCVFSANVFFL